MRALAESLTSIKDAVFYPVSETKQRVQKRTVLVVLLVRRRQKKPAPNGAFLSEHKTTMMANPLFGGESLHDSAATDNTEAAQYNEIGPEAAPSALLCHGDGNSHAGVNSPYGQASVVSEHGYGGLGAARAPSSAAYDAINRDATDTYANLASDTHSSLATSSGYGHLASDRGAADGGINPAFRGSTHDRGLSNPLYSPPDAASFARRVTNPAYHAPDRSAPTNGEGDADVGYLDVSDEGEGEYFDVSSGGHGAPAAAVPPPRPPKAGTPAYSMAEAYGNGGDGYGLYQDLAPLPGQVGEDVYGGAGVAPEVPQLAAEDIWLFLATAVTCGLDMTSSDAAALVSGASTGQGTFRLLRQSSSSAGGMVLTFCTGGTVRALAGGQGLLP